MQDQLVVIVYSPHTDSHADKSETIKGGEKNKVLILISRESPSQANRLI